MSSSSLQTLATYLAGEFDNQAQSLEQPIWFVHLRLWHRPLPWRINGNLALFAEQANVLYLDKPYRQRVVVLQPIDRPDCNDSNQFQAQYYAFKRPEQVRGAGVDADRLQALNLDDLELLPGCLLTVTHIENRFKAEPEPDAKCCFQYDGQTRQVILGFEASADRFLSFDRGVEPDTGKVLWGAIMGAYEFRKTQDFSGDLVGDFVTE